MATTIRLDDATIEILRHLEKQSGMSKKNILIQALNNYQRDKIIDDLNSYYKSLQEDPTRWKEELAEREIWETSVNDGLEDL